MVIMRARRGRGGGGTFAGAASGSRRGLGVEAKHVVEPGGGWMTAKG